MSLTWVISYCLKKGENKYHPSLLFWENQHGRKTKFHFQLVSLNNNIWDHRMDLVLRPGKWDGKVLAPSLLLDSTDIGWEFHVRTRMLTSVVLSWTPRPLSDCFPNIRLLPPPPLEPFHIFWASGYLFLHLVMKFWNISRIFPSASCLSLHYLLTFTHTWGRKGN